MMTFANMCNWESEARFKKTGEVREFKFSAFVNVPAGYPNHFTVPREYWTQEQARTEKNIPHLNFPWGFWQVFVEIDDHTNLWIGECAYREIKMEDYKALQAIGREYILKIAKEQHEVRV